MMRRIRRIMFALRARSRKIRKSVEQSQLLATSSIQLNTLENWTFNKIIDFVIRPGEMVDAECRSEFYNLNVTLLESIFCKKKKG